MTGSPVEATSAFARLEHARALVAGARPSPSKTRTYVETSRFLMLANRSNEAVEFGRLALALAKELGLRELQASALNSIGAARVNLGEREGFAELEEAFSIGSAINSPEALRALGNHASLIGDLGDLRRSRQLYEQVIELCGRLGISGFVLWCEVELALLDYEAGDWDAAAARVDTFLAAVGDLHYMEPVARQIEAAIAMAQGEIERALASSERALTFARNAKDPQVLYPALAARARMLALAGRAPDASRLADELLDLVAEREFQANQWGVDLAVALDHVGRAADAGRVLAPLVLSTRWRDAAVAYALGDFAGAADILADMGDHTDEAYARLRAAETGAGAVQLEAALAFYRSVGATAYVRRAEALLPASA